MSLHRYDHSHFFPGSPEAEYDHIGSGDGLGYNVNVAWNDVSVCVHAACDCTDLVSCACLLFTGVHGRWRLLVSISPGDSTNRERVQSSTCVGLLWI